MHLLGLDIGTTGCKAMIFDPEGRIKGQGFHEYDVICTEPAMGEQDAERVWDLTCQAVREAVNGSGAADIRALSVSVQGDAIIPVDRQWRALRPAILGMDYRSEKQAQACEQLFGGFDLFELTGMRPHPINALTKLLFLRDRWPEVFRQAWKICTYEEFILGKLGAEPVIDYSMASRTMAFEIAARQWSQTILNRLDLTESLLAKAVPSGTPVGQIRREVASSLGLSPEVLLVAGGHDQPCAALGAGVIKSGKGLISTGTAEVLATAFGSPALTRTMFDSFYPCTLHVCPNSYFTFSLNHVGGLLLKWFRDQLGAAEIRIAQSRGLTPYQLIDEQMPTGPSPVMVVPHFNGSGTPGCDLTAKGAILGLTMASTRQDIARAILEGLTFELLLNLETMLQCGIDAEDLIAVGGGAKSSVWLQIKADILNRPIRTLRCRDAACLGAAMLAGLACGEYGSIEQAVAATVIYDREFLPQSAMSRRYAEKYQVYRQLYPVLRTINSQL
jgi:xylulokinase